jgi:hypothetical protein
MQNSASLRYENKFRICNQQNILMNKGFDKIYNLQSGGNQFQLSIKSIAFGYMKNTRSHAFCMMMKGTKQNRLAHQIELRVTEILNFLAAS